MFLARYLRASSGFALMKSTALAQAAAKRLATSGRFLMKSVVKAQPAAKASAFSSPRMYFAITPASTVFADADLVHDRGARLERIAAVEGAGLHRVDVLAHVELVDGVVAVLEADLGENALGGVEVGRARAPTSA